MTIGKAAIVMALLGVTGCAGNSQLACGPALPPIATAAPAAPVVAAPAVVAVAPAAPVVAAPLTPDQQQALALQNRAAVAGR